MIVVSARLLFASYFGLQSTVGSKLNSSAKSLPCSTAAAAQCKLAGSRALVWWFKQLAECKSRLLWLSNKQQLPVLPKLWW